MSSENGTAIYFPPYGVMDYDDTESTGVILPIDWLPSPQDKGSTVQEKWVNWLEGVVVQINEVLWPTWDMHANQWKPSASLHHVEALTRADFEVLEQMQRERVNRGLDRMPDSPNRSETIRSHRQIFIIEDGRPLNDGDKVIEFASYYDSYDSKLPADLAAEVEGVWFDSTHHKLRRTPNLVKLRLQRPRPYQTAMMLGYPNYVHELAVTGLTPSSCSGHCLQGLTGMGGVFEYFHSSGVQLDQNNLDSMRQYAVDIGDRRVMAGVHYPSDNLCSWIILMNLADRAFRDPAVKCFLWKAISERSWVYASIVAYDAKKGGSSAHRPALDHLHSLAPVHCC